jgi:hypothetical protein
VYIIPPSCHSVKYFFEGNFWEIVFIGFRGFRRFNGFRGGWYRLTAMSMKSALRDFLLCLQCCIMESRSPLPQAEILQRISEPGSCVSIAFTLSKHLKARPAGVAVRRRRIEASILGKKFGPILRASPSSFLGKEPALRESPSYCISHAKHGGSENHKTGPASRRKCTPSAYGTSPRESVSRDFQVAVLPYKSRSLATPEGEVCSPLSF